LELRGAPNDEPLSKGRRKKNLSENDNRGKSAEGY
jgi:hypothetical protein